MSAHDTASRGRQPVPDASLLPGDEADEASSTTGSALAAAALVAIAEEAPAHRSSPWIALRYRDFRLLWAGGFISQMGSQMRIVAVGVQLWDLTHDTAAIGLLGFFNLVPIVLLSLFGGVIADALDRRKLLMITQSIMATSSAVLALATIFGLISAPLIYVIGALGAATIVFDNPARSALVPSLVPRRHLPNALSLNIIVWQVATIIGPTIAGIFLALPDHAAGYTIIYLFDAVSFSAVIVALFMIRARPKENAVRDVSFRAALDGLRFLRRTPIILSTMVLDFFATLLGAATALLPAIAEQILHVDRQYWGVLYAAPAVGAVVAGLIMSWLGNVRHQGWIVIWSVIAYGIATIFFGVSSTYWVTVLALAGTGAADTVSMVMRQTIRQLSTPDELRGRMTSVNMVFYMGGPQLGELEAGMAAKVIGISPSILLGGLGVILVTAFLAFAVPPLRNYDRDKSVEVDH